MTFIAHDPLTVWTTMPPGIVAFAAFVCTNSYGRTGVAFKSDTNGAGPSGCGFYTPSTYTMDYWFNAAPGYCSWSYTEFKHESIDSTGCNDAPSAIGGQYGDYYDSQGSSGTEKLNTFYKECLGFIGYKALRPLIYATNSGTYVITDAMSQSAGPKCLKLLFNRNAIYTGWGSVYQDQRTFWYFELRNDHLINSPSGGGKHHKNGGGTSTGPAVQIRNGTPHYIGEPSGNITSETFRDDLGSGGGLLIGQSMSFTSDNAIGDPFFNYTHTYRAVTVKVTAISSTSATIQVTMQ